MTDPYNESDFAVMVHTALRKACDSTITSIAYNMIHATNGPWGAFVSLVYSQFNWSRPEESFAERVDELSEWLPTTNELKEVGHELTGEERSMLIALILTFKLFDGDDWKGACAYLKD